MPPLRLRYQTLEFGDTDIHVRTLRDRQQFQDVEGIAESLGISSATWPLFGIIWESGRILADLMHGYAVGGKRILEVGCGIGLASLVLNARHADITATDQHPEAEGFLTENVKLNRGEIIPFERTGWCDDSDTLGRFDLIIGSDLLYEREHAVQLSSFIDEHANEQCEVIIVDPGRGQSSQFTRQMTELGYIHVASEAEYNDPLKPIFKGRILHYIRRVTNSS